MATTFKLAAFRLELDILDAMDRLRARDGVPASEQVRRALRAYLARNHVQVALPPRKTPTTQRRRR
jgi:hypothetical protein